MTADEYHMTEFYEPRDADDSFPPFDDDEEDDEQDDAAARGAAP